MAKSKTFETQRNELQRKPLKRRGTEDAEDFGVVRREKNRRER